MDTKVNLKDTFAFPDWDEWKKQVTDSLKGADYDKVMRTRTYEGITLEPIYRKEDIAGLGHCSSMPGTSPYVRGNDPKRFIEQGWKIAQAQLNPDLKALNATLKEELMRGLSMVNLKLKRADNPLGIELKTEKDIARVLDGIDLKAAPLYIQTDIDDIGLFALLDTYLSAKKESLRELEGFIGFDPTGEFARKGYFDMPLSDLWQKVSDAVIERSQRAPKMRCFIVDGTIYEASGASGTQELAFVLSTAIGYIQGMMQSGMDIDTIAPLFAVQLSLGSNFFMEISKIRAFRLLWAEMIKAFGGSEESQKIWIHGKTASFNKTTYDLYVNMLRTTTESFSGVIGGVDSLETDPFDSLVKPDNAFARRIARNQQLILAEESHFAKVIDPAGGCYYIESLTAQLAELAWSIVQELEKAGGMVRALRAGLIHEMTESVAKARMDAVHKRKDVFVGVNMYANPLDEAFEVSQITKVDISTKPVSLEKGPLPKRRAVMKVEELRAAISEKSPKIMLLNMGEVSDFKARADFSSGFFQMAGFQVMSEQSFISPEEAIAAAKAADVDAYCICSTDANYVELVAPLCSGLKPATMILAGYPTDKIEEYQASGIDIFIHIRANAYETLKDLAMKLEVIR